MRKVKSRLALLLAVIMIAGSLQLPVFAVRRSGAGIPSGASAEAGVEDPGQVTETELLDLVPDSAGTGGTEPQDPVLGSAAPNTIRSTLECTSAPAHM